MNCVLSHLVLKGYFTTPAICYLNTVRGFLNIFAANEQSPLLARSSSLARLYTRYTLSPSRSPLRSHQPSVERMTQEDIGPSWLLS